MVQFVVVYQPEYFKEGIDNGLRVYNINDPYLEDYPSMYTYMWSCVTRKQADDSCRFGYEIDSLNQSILAMSLKLGNNVYDSPEVSEKCIHLSYNNSGLYFKLHHYMGWPPKTVLAMGDYFWEYVRSTEDEMDDDRIILPEMIFNIKNKVGQLINFHL